MEIWKTCLIGRKLRILIFRSIHFISVSFNVFEEVARFCNGLFFPNEAEPHPSSDEAPAINALNSPVGECLSALNLLKGKLG